MFVFICFCKDPIEYPYASGSLRRPHPTYPLGSFAHTFSALQKRPLLSKIVYDFLTQAGPKNLPKNQQLFGRFFGPACVRIPYVILLRRGLFCNVENVCAKDPKEYMACGLLEGPACVRIPYRIHVETFQKIEKV